MCSTPRIQINSAESALDRGGTEMPRIMTVLGPIDPAQLGGTYAHEHLLGGPPEWSADHGDADLTMLSLEAAQRELGLFKLAGGQSIVEMSTPEYNRRPEELRRLAQATG